MASAILQLPCLGRPFHTGSLYNCYYEKLVPGNNIWENRIIQPKKQVSSNYEIITQDSLESKFHSLGVNDSLKLSFLAGMIEDSSFVKYLADRVSSKDQARVTLKYATTTYMEEVNAEELSSIENLSASTGEAATHVVTGILYGSEVFFVFDRSVSPTENMCDISGCLEDLVQCIPKLESCKTSEEENQKVHCTCYGNLSLSNPLSYKDAAEVCSKLPTLLKDKSVPVVAFLHPLLSGKPAGAPVCSTLISKIEEIMELLQDAEMQCKCLKKNEHCSKFAGYHNELSSFLTLLNRFKAKSVNKLSELVPKIRQSILKEAELNDEIASINMSPFNAKEIGIYIKNKTKELKLLCQYTNNLCKDPVVHFISSANASDLLELTTDFQYDFVICFALNVTAKESNYLQKIKKHMKLTSNPISDCQAEWFENQKIMKDLRHKSKQFLDFLKLNKQENLAFVVVDRNEEIESITNPVILLYSSGVPEYFEPPSQPGIPMVDSVTDNSINLYWSPPEEGADSVLSYNFYYCASAQSKEAVLWKNISTQHTTEKIQVKGLSQDTEYLFFIEAVCSAGISNKSKESQARTTPQYLARPADNVVKISELIKDGAMIYQLPVKPTSKDIHNHLYKMRVGSCGESTRRPERVLVMVGATGAGKSTLINALANYILGIQWEDTFRFKVITGEGDLSQAHRQTKYITAYTFHHTIFEYSLTIVDTPGFGDTNGIENDRRITKQIKKFFSADQFKGIDNIHGIGFVTQASIPRLTPTQKYIFDAVLSIFGKDIVDNIFLMTTFADANDPPVLEAVKVAGIPYKYSFKFNNSAIFARNDESQQFNRMFWEMGTHSLSSFFEHFSISSPQSLSLTREVLAEREQLEVMIPGLERQVKIGLSRVDEILQEERVLQQHEAEINANKDFNYRVKINKHRKVPLRGVHTTNCLICSFTCHDSCVYSNDADKAKCCAMNNGYCTVCPKKCHWQNHSNTPYFFEYYSEYENRTYDDLKVRYETAKTGKDKAQSMIAANEGILQQLQAEVYSVLEKMRRSIHRLDEIALRPNPLSDIEYIDLLIESEKREHKTGWKERVHQYEQIRRDAQVLKKVPKASTKEKSKSWWSLWK